MFQKKDPQRSLFAAPMLLPEEKRERLEADWPGAFRRAALPLLDSTHIRSNMAVLTRLGLFRETMRVFLVEGLHDRDLGPKEMVADTNYGSTENVLDCESLGTELVSPVAGPKVEAPAEV